MNEKEIKEYINRKDELLLKLSGKDKDTLEWILFGYNECARLLDEKEKENKQLKEKLQQKENIINKANKKIDNMFDMGDGNKVIDDLLEIQKILDNLDNKGE